MTVSVYAKCCEIPSCCGAAIVHAFCSDETKRIQTGWIHGDNFTAAWKALLSKFFYQPVSYQFWFAKEMEFDDDDDEIGFREDFDFEELRAIVMALPQAKQIAGYVNPNSGNYVEGWLVDNTKKDIKL